MSEEEKKKDEITSILLETSYENIPDHYNVASDMLASISYAEEEMKSRMFSDPGRISKKRSE